MPDWSDDKWIKAQLHSKWESGRMLQSLFRADDLFPLKLALKKPARAELNAHFAEAARWVQNLKAGSKPETGFGYELAGKEIHHRQSGRNWLPTHAIIPTAEDALKLLNKAREAALFLTWARQIEGTWPALGDWAARYPKKVMAVGKDWDGVLAVLDWFAAHPASGLYLRQLDINGIDTKFIERRKGLLQDLLDVILPAGAIAPDAPSFELRYGLRQKMQQIRLRLLDRTHYWQGCISDVTLPLEQLARWRPDVTTVFITENEINGLCFPEAQDCLVIFGLGYGVEALRSIPWLRCKEVYYWGDLDTHGFAMLNQVRGFLPQAQSLLMDEATLLACRTLWCTEERPFLGELERLTDGEYRLFCLLKSNTLGEKVRLEQERIPFGRVVQTLRGIVYN